MSLFNQIRKKMLKGKSSVKRYLSLVLIFMVVLLVLISARDFIRSYQKYRTTEETSKLIEISDYLFQAVRHYGFERGRVNVVLRDTGPIENMASNREFILEQKTLGDKAFETAIDRLSEIEKEKIGSEISAVKDKFREVGYLRNIYTEEIKKPFIERDREFPVKWFGTITGLIESVEDLLYRIQISVSGRDSENGIGFRLKLSALSLRNTAGPECSQMLALNSGKTPLTNSMDHDLIALRSETEVMWKEIKRINEYLEYPPLEKAVSQVELLYFDRTVKLLDAVKLSMSDSGREKVSQKELTETMVHGLEAIAGIMDSAKQYTSGVTGRNRAQALKELVRITVLSAVLVFALILIFVIVELKIISPLTDLSLAMDRIAGDDLEIKLPYTGRKDEIGDIARAVRLFREFSIDRKKQTENLKREKEIAEQATLAKGRFLANMSHEIRTPLNGIIGLTEMSLSLEPPEKIKQNLELSMSASESLLLIINDILDFEKIAADKVKIEKLPFNLYKALEDSVGLLRKLADRKKLSLKLSISGDVPQWIKADKLRIDQVVRNLLSNAIKFTDIGEVSVTVDFNGSGQGSPGFLSILVRDSGCGIPEDKISEIFEIFTQVDSSYSKKYEGTGLGLSICKSLSEKMGGSISVESGVGKGSEFKFQIPVEKCDPLPEKETVIRNSGHRPRKILFAEDDRLNQLYLRHFLEADGHTVTFVQTGKELLTELNSSKYDFVISDVQMPEMDGLEAVKRIRRGESGAGNSSIPVVAFTAYSSNEDRMVFESAGFSDYLGKPVHINQLRKMIERVSGTL